MAMGMPREESSIFVLLKMALTLPKHSQKSTFIFIRRIFFFFFFFLIVFEEETHSTFELHKTD